MAVGVRTDKLRRMNATPHPNPLESRLKPGSAPWQRAWYEVIFEAETPAGRAFDVLLLIVIVVSIAVVMLESVDRIQEQPVWASSLAGVEWVITLLFSLEFIARLACVDRPMRYVFSFFGLVDIVSILPSYLALVFTGTHALATVRTLRLLRVFRVLKMGRHLKEANTLIAALRQTWPKITVFLTVIFCSIIILGTIMYLIEGGDESSGFSDIPTSVYWAIATITTVGYGDLAPQTPLGRFVATMVMLLGYAIIIVPTGIFSAEVMSNVQPQGYACKACGRIGHAEDATFCAGCGERLGPDDSSTAKTTDA